MGYFQSSFVLKKYKEVKKINALVKKVKLPSLVEM